MELLKQQNSPDVIKQNPVYNSPLHDQDSLSPKGHLNKEIACQVAASGNAKEEINEIKSLEKQSNLHNFFSSQGNIGLYMSQSELSDLRQAHHQSQSQNQQVNQMSQMSSGHHQQQISQIHLQHQNYPQISQSQSFLLHTQQMGFPGNDPDNSIDDDDDDEEDNKNNSAENLSRQNCKFFSPVLIF